MIKLKKIYTLPVGTHFKASVEKGEFPDYWKRVKI